MINSTENTNLRPYWKSSFATTDIPWPRSTTEVLSSLWCTDSDVNV